MFLLRYSHTPLERIAGTAMVKTRSLVNHSFCESWNQPQYQCRMAADISSLQSTQQKCDTMKLAKTFTFSFQSHDEVKIQMVDINI